MSKVMTKGERDDLLRLVRQRERVLKSAAEKRSADMLADFEKKCTEKYPFANDETWTKAAKMADEAIAEADRMIAERAAELGIPDEFRPCIRHAYFERGEGAWKGRQAELRRLAKAQIEALEKAARVEIERLSVTAQTEIIANGLTSDAAKAFLAQMPAVDSLMPTLDLAQIETESAKRRRLN